MESPRLIFWSENERALLAEYIQFQLDRLGPQERFMVSVVPEMVFARDSSLRPFLGAHKVLFTGEWSIWLREALEGVPLDYNLLMEAGIRELSHTIAAHAELEGETRASRFASVHERLRDQATKAGIWPVSAPPDEFRHLFAPGRVGTSVGLHIESGEVRG